MPNKTISISQKDAEAIVAFFESENPAHLTYRALSASQNIKRTLEGAEDVKVDTTYLDVDELIKVGMAISVVNHEFSSTISDIRDWMHRLKQWADVNEGLMKIHQGIKGNFDTLDGYLNMFIALDKRLAPNKTYIKGHNIESFIFKLFKTQLELNNIKLSTSKTFRQVDLHATRAKLYPVFVNIVDNAIHWIKGYTVNGSIFIDLDGEDIIISNNGAPINEADKESIFSMGFTRREFGRGIGLSVVQKALSEDGFKLSLTTPADGFNVAFKISKEAE